MSNIGFRIFSKINRPNKDLVESFRGVPVANIGDCVNRSFILDARIRPLNKSFLVGTAFTVKSRTADNLMLHAAIDMAMPGDIIMVDVQGDTVNSITGEIMMLWAQTRGIGGVVIDGAIRDVEALREFEMPIYAAGVTPKGPYKDGPGEINVPISCGGVTVNPGDIIVGDSDGIIVINPKEAPELLIKAQAFLEKEIVIMKKIREEKQWDRSWVRKALIEKGCQFID